MNDSPSTIPSLLERGAKLWPDKTYLTDGARHLTFAEVDRESDLLALGLQSCGVSRGDRVCTILDTGIDAVLIWFAINKLNAISAPVNTSYVGEYLRHQVNDCGARIVIAEAKYVDRLTALADALPHVTKLFHRGEAADRLPWPAAPFEDLRAKSGVPEQATISPSDLSMIIYTSGTTGASKGCMISHSYARRHADNMIYAHGMSEDDIVWMPLPLFHLTGACGLTLAALIQGATVHLVPKFSVRDFWPQIEKGGATFVLAMGSMLGLIASAPENESEKRCFGQIRKLCGAPFPASLQQRWRDRFGVHAMGSPGFGFTEASIVTRYPIGQPQPDGASGKRFEDYDVRIFDESGLECPPGVAGEVVIRPMKPGAIFSGYWNNPAATLEIMKDLWLHTGDVGKFDEDGYFYFLDRRKDYLRKGGENISSVEMEAIFREHDCIADVAIHAVPSEISEDEVKATVVLKPGAALDPIELCRWAIERVPHFAVPRYIEFCASLPRTPNGKVRKIELRQRGVTAETWDRERSPIALYPGRYRNAS